MKGSLGEVREQWICSVLFRQIHFLVRDISPCCPYGAQWRRHLSGAVSAPEKSVDIKTPAVQRMAQCFGLSSVLYSQVFGGGG